MNADHQHTGLNLAPLDTWTYWRCVKNVGINLPDGGLKYLQYALSIGKIGALDGIGLLSMRLAQRA